MIRILLLATIFVVGCNKEREAKSSQDDRKEQAEELYQSMLTEAAAFRDRDDGWIEKGCDAMIWSGKYAASTGVTGVNIEAAEFENTGRFGRRPEPRCWTPEEGDVGAKTTWSRDMAIAGLIPWVWRTKRLDVLERHLAYGNENLWKMGEPLDDGRTVYTPSLVGILYQLAYSLGGVDNPNRLWPSVYPAGLKDYQAHLQVMDIWIRGEVAESRGEGDAVPRKPEGAKLVNVSETMYERLVEHAAREPKCWTYQAMLGIYDGTMAKALDVVLAGEFDCTYVRCETGKGCMLAEKIWALDLILRRLE